MGSVLSYDEKCPRCEQETAFSDYYYKTFEDYFSCPCGFSYSYELKRDNKGELVTKNGKPDYSFYNLIMIETIREPDDTITTTELPKFFKSKWEIKLNKLWSGLLKIIKR